MYNKEDLYDAWHWLVEHPMFRDEMYSKDGEDISVSQFTQCLTMDLAKVSPETKAIEDEGSKNTLVQVWLECGPWDNLDELDEYGVELAKAQGQNGLSTHDYRLDCGGDTFEQAVMNLAANVLKFYGDYEGEGKDWVRPPYRDADAPEVDADAE